jgi:uracil-DNA glycosylase
VKKVATAKLGESWAEHIGSEFGKSYMRKLSAYLKKERKKYTIYPAREDVFRAYQLTPYDKVKVVIIGQD